MAPHPHCDDTKRIALLGHYYYYGWYIFESPAGCNGSGCYNFTDNGKTVSVFQLPEFSGSAFTGYLCGSSFSCRPINSNNDPVGQFFLYHRSEDVVPSTISGANTSNIPDLMSFAVPIYSIVGIPLKVHIISLIGTASITFTDASCV